MSGDSLLKYQRPDKLIERGQAGRARPITLL